MQDARHVKHSTPAARKGNIPMSARTPTRKPISTRDRFEVFKRDEFTCQYCGRKPPAAVLHLDHIHPVSQGGSNEVDNLATSCKDCNLGKSDVPLGQTRPRPGVDKIFEMREAREQLQAYQDFLMEERAGREAQAEVIASELTRRLGVNLTERNLREVATFLRDLPLAEVLDAVDVAERRGLDGHSAWQYFCGVCWTKLKASKTGRDTYAQMLEDRERKAN